MIETQEISNGISIDMDERTTVVSRGDVMVVDDQPANLKLMEDMLRHEGYAVRSFPRGRLALIAAAQRAPDLILLDINMPEMDGFEVCTRLKADKKLSSIPAWITLPNHSSSRRYRRGLRHNWDCNKRAGRNATCSRIRSTER